MKTKEQCLEILGSGLVERVERVLSERKIDDSTIARVLDYLALHKQTFPYIDIENLAKNMCENLKESIDFRGLKDSFRGLFKQKNYGFATGHSVVINARPLKFVLPSKQYNVMLDALIRHELDHIATTHYKSFSSQEEYRDYLLKNIKEYEELFDQKLNAEIVKKAVEQNASSRFIDWVRDPRTGEMKPTPRKRLVTKNSGVHCDEYEHVGSEALNEGVTAYKMKKMDKFAGQGGVLCQSGYVLGEEVVGHFAKHIGEEELIRMQSEGDFGGIVELYKHSTGRSGAFVKQMLEKLESQKHKTAFHKLFAQVRYGLSGRMDKSTQQKFDEIVSGDSCLED